MDIFQGIGFGFAAASQPGPFQTYLISQSISQGWRRTLPSALAPLLSDGPIIALCLLALSQVPIWMAQVLYAVSGLFILYLAWGALRAWRAWRAGGAGRAGRAHRIPQAVRSHAAGGVHRSRRSRVGGLP